MVDIIGDCGWSKRSFGHSYNANSAAGVLIDYRTKKILYMGIKNKFCIIYNRNLENKIDHDCFKNFEGPSTKME